MNEPWQVTAYQAIKLPNQPADVNNDYARSSHFQYAC